MELYIGGYAQGKTAYVKEMYPAAEVIEMFDASCRAEIIIWNRFHLAVRKYLTEGKGKEEILDLVWQARDCCKQLIIVSDEIGNGIVPMEKEDRLCREETGRILCKIAAQADKVERIICGIPQRIK